MNICISMTCNLKEKYCTPFNFLQNFVPRIMHIHVVKHSHSKMIGTSNFDSSKPQFITVFPISLYMHYNFEVWEMKLTSLKAQFCNKCVCCNHVLLYFKLLTGDTIASMALSSSGLKSVFFCSAANRNFTQPVMAVKVRSSPLSILLSSWSRKSRFFCRHSLCLGEDLHE